MLVIFKYMEKNEQLTYLESSDIRMVLILSVWPTSFPTLLPVRGSHNRTTRSGDPEAIVCPSGSTARA